MVLRAGNYSFTTTGYEYTYDVGTIVPWSGWIHYVKLTGLQTSTTYYYICGSSNEGDGYSTEFNFTTRSAQPQPIIVAVLGDQGTAIPAGFLVTDQMVDDHRKTNFDMILHCGDIAYAGVDCCDEIESIWDLWFDQVEPLTSIIPYMTTVGNHESYFNFTSYDSRFRMPGNESGGLGNFWWSLDLGYVHFISISSEHPYSSGSPQYSWIVQDLQKANANRQNIPWIVMSAHRPFYCSNDFKYSSHIQGQGLLGALETILKQYQVDLTLTGHVHSYERTFPVYNGTVIGNFTNTTNQFTNPQATIHIVQGVGGALYSYGWEPQPVWSASRHNLYGYAQMHVDQNEIAYYYYEEWTGGLVDSFTITKTSSQSLR